MYRYLPLTQPAQGCQERAGGRLGQIDQRGVLIPVMSSGTDSDFLAEQLLLKRYPAFIIIRQLADL